MHKAPQKGIRVETREISDADAPPEGCPHCGSIDYVRERYHFRDLQDLGEPGIARRVRYEEVYWFCKACETVFRVPLPGIPRSPYMLGVIKYATARVLDKGDAARRVTEDLQRLHNVDVTSTTVQAWVDSTGGLDADTASLEGAGVVKDFSGVLTVDGTFRAVKEKKSALRGGGSEPLLLHLTRLADGRLAAYWHEAKPKQKRKSSSRA